MKKVFFFFYFLLLLLFVSFSYLFIDPGFFYLKFLFTNFHQTHRAVVTLFFFIFLIIFFMFYALSLWLLKQQEISSKDIFLLIGISSAILLFAYPAMLSFDIFNYIATAKVTFFYHENPYIIMPIALTHDPILLFMHAANKTALYAPFWILLTGIPYLLGFGNFLLTLFLFKLFIGLFYFATVWLFWKLTKNIFKTAFFALNPLVLIEIFVSGHNDIVMMFLLLVSISYVLKKQLKTSSIFFLLSILIKYATAIVLPLYWFVNKKRGDNATLFFWITLGMYLVFFLSAFREEMYPWYSLWFLLPVSFIAGNNLITWISATFTFSMLLRYIPFMLLGTYFGPTPMLKFLLMILPVFFVTLFYIGKKKYKRQHI